MTAARGPSALLPAGEVAAIFRVTRHTVTAWDAQGRLPAYLRLPGRHRRWHRAQVDALLAGEPVPVIPLPSCPDVMTGTQVSAAFGVGLKTLHRWDEAGFLVPASRTSRGHRRYRGADVAAVMRGEKPGGTP